MAEPTEQEQIKQTQLLEKVEKSSSTASGKLDKVIAGLKSGEQESLLTDIKEQGEEKIKSDKKAAVKDQKLKSELHNEQLRAIDNAAKEEQKLKEEHHSKQITAITGLKDRGEQESLLTDIKEQGEDKVESDEKLQETVEDFAKDSSEADKKQEAQNQFIKDQEKRKEGLAKMAFAFQQRAAKLATRIGKDAWAFGKGKINTVTRAVGSFFDNLMKLLMLLGLWFALSWLKGKDLTKLWEAFVNKLKEWADILPDWVKNLNIQSINLKMQTTSL